MLHIAVMLLLHWSLYRVLLLQFLWCKPHYIFMHLLYRKSVQRLSVPHSGREPDPIGERLHHQLSHLQCACSILTCTAATQKLCLATLLCHTKRCPCMVAAD